MKAVCGQIIAGVDEAGRGPVAGPVVAAAVILDPNHPISGLDDSKKLRPCRRMALEQQIIEHAICWSIGAATVNEIDEINILHATMLAMRRACIGLARKPDLIRVDGNCLPQLDTPAVAVIGGDALHAEISAASILAKQERDRQMIALSTLYPGYGFDRHKGYPTKMHLEALATLGATLHHRRSFAPVRKTLEL